MAIQNKPKFSVALRSDVFQKLILDTLGDKNIANKFTTEMLSVVSNNPNLQSCDTGSILSAGFVAQSLKLPLSLSLGFCYIIPFGTKAQFQVGYKGLIQLAQRSGLYERLGVRPVHEGEYIGQDEFGDDLFHFSHEFDNNKVVGYYAYFKLLNGFKKTLYMTVEQAQQHGKKYSKSYKNLWTSDFDMMAQKTVLKLLINRYGPMTVELQTAIKTDQTVFNNNGTYEYSDNPLNDQKTSKSTVQAPNIFLDDTQVNKLSEEEVKTTKETLPVVDTETGEIKGDLESETNIK